MDVDEVEQSADLIRVIDKDKGELLAEINPIVNNESTSFIDEQPCTQNGHCNIAGSNVNLIAPKSEVIDIKALSGIESSSLEHLVGAHGNEEGNESDHHAESDYVVSSEEEETRNERSHGQALLTLSNSLQSVSSIASHPSVIHGNVEEWLKKMTQNVSNENVDCPLSCPSNEFQSCDKKKVKDHLQRIHIRKAVTIPGSLAIVTLCKCSEQKACAHYHCPCGRVIKHRPGRMLRHARMHAAQSQAAGQASQAAGQTMSDGLAFQAFLPASAGDSASREMQERAQAMGLKPLIDCAEDVDTEDDGDAGSACMPAVYGCEQCDYTSPHLNNLKQHMRRHNTDAQRHQCEHCERSFRYSYDLTEHVRVVHEKSQVFACAKCPKVFQSRQSLSSHKTRNHTAAKFVCWICGKHLWSKRDQVAHAAKHSGIGFMCELCGRSYQYKSSLLEHQKTCAGPKAKVTSYSCKLCDKRFAKRSSLTDHVTAKHEKTSFKCPCGKEYPWRPSYLRHKRSCVASDALLGAAMRKEQEILTNLPGVSHETLTNLTGMTDIQNT